MKIMLCVDGSPSSNLVSSALLTRKLDDKTEVRLVIAVEPAESRFFHLGPIQSQFMHSHELDSARRCVNEVRDELEKLIPHAKIEEGIAVGHVKEALLSAADKWKPDLIVVGSRGIRRDDPLALGSVSQAILEHSSCPVLVARKVSNQSPVMNILIPLDHSKYSTAAAEWALQQQWTKSPRFTLLSVVPPMPKGYALEDNVERAALFLHEYEQMERSSKVLLKTWANKFDEKFGARSTEIKLVCGEPRNEILSAVVDRQNAMIIMGSHGHTALKRFLLGSVSRAVSLQADCCVEVVRS